MPSRADIDAEFAAYHDAVNMTHAELARWARDPCSELASEGRTPIQRNLALLSTPRSRWGETEYKWSRRTRSFIARMRGVKPGRPAGAGCPSKRDIALKNWAFDPDKYRPNRRPRIYEARPAAKQMRETFTDRPIEDEKRLRFGYPPVMKNVGDSLAVAYGSDKWQKPNRQGTRKIELYKHLAESRNRALVLPGLLRDERDPEQGWPTLGPLVSIETMPMPRHFAVLGLFEECNLKLYTGGSDAAPRFGRSVDDGVVRVEVRHGMLGASAVQWNQVEPYKSERARLRSEGVEPEDLPSFNEPFLLVYTEEDGVLMIVVGERLDISRDGIIG